MPTSGFIKPLRRLSTELAWLESEFMRAAPDKHRHTQLTCEMAVVRLHDAWARFCRELIIRSARGRTVTLTGTRLHPSHSAIVKRSSVIPLLISMYPRRRRFEPRWADATECIEAGTRLAIGNLSTVAGALGAVNSPANDIRRVRNYYAHRSQRTAHDALSTRFFSSGAHPEVFDLANYTSGSTTVLESWTAGLILIATAAAQ